MITKLQIHPAIGIARLGDSPDDFYLAPETTGGLPTQCDRDGNAVIDPITSKEVPVANFKDDEGRIKRQAARFQVFVEQDGELKALKIGDTIQAFNGGGKVVDIKWTVHLANKKASWYEFRQLEGEHGYANTHPLRNANITDPNDRQSLIIDPGPYTIGVTNGPRKASLAKGTNKSGRAQTFPPENLAPCNITKLGDIMTDMDGRLIALGGHGNSGSMLTKFGNPKISTYANNDGWFDDTSDGPVMAIIHFFNEADQQIQMTKVEHPAWLIVGYPRYSPEVPDLVTMDDLLYDLYVQKFGIAPYLYGPGNFDDPVPVDPSDKEALSLWRSSEKRYNPNYYPDFNTEIYPILVRPFNYQWVTNFLAISFPAHEVNYRGDFDMAKISIPPGPPKTGTQECGQGDPTDIKGKDPNDPYKFMRKFIYESLRLPGEQNRYARDNVKSTNPIWMKELMPALCGDNPITNVLPSKFFRLTDTQLFFIRQWADGKFRNDKPFTNDNLQAFPNGQQFVTDETITRGTLGNILGGSFCPGAEVCWIMRNPSIYTVPYRFKVNPDFIPTIGSSKFSKMNPFIPPQLSLSEDMSVGLEPGDLTKRSGIPWQADFNECYTQNIDVTYELWNKQYDASGNPYTPPNSKVSLTMWWPTHRPMQVYLQNGTQIEWSAYVPQTKQGDLQMVTAWKEFGFVVRRPGGKTPFYEVERNPEWIPKTDI